jgi:hypothetical protein
MYALQFNNENVYITTPENDPTIVETFSGTSVNKL